MARGEHLQLQPPGKKECVMKKKILIVEDNEQNLYLVSFILEKHGYEVFAARDGQEGINMAISIKPDLILLDIHLPVMDGYAVARELRKNAELAQVPIIAVTSYAMTGDREKTINPNNAFALK